MSMTLQTTYTLAAMVATFVISSWKSRSPEISMVITAVVGALVAGFGFPVRLLVEGTLTYIDLALQFITASLFMNFYAEIGATNALVRNLVARFYDNKWLMLFLLAFVMLIPGAITGAGSVSILVVGGLVATVLEFMGFPPARRAAFVFIMAILSAAAPRSTCGQCSWPLAPTCPMSASTPYFSCLYWLSQYSQYSTSAGAPNPSPKQRCLRDCPPLPGG